MSGDILDLIDAATGCQQCEGPLNGSVSDDFCSELCQTTWAAKQVGTEPELDEYATYQHWGMPAPVCYQYRQDGSRFVTVAGTEWVPFGMTATGGFAFVASTEGDSDER